MAVNAGAAAARSGGGGAVLPTPLLAESLEPLRGGERLVMLDLGPPRAATVGYLSGYRCRLGIADALGELVDADAALQGGVAGEHLAHVLPAQSFAGSQLILCWSVLDYLSAESIRALGRHLLSLAAPGAVLHALVAYGVSSQPSRPLAYTLAAEGVCPGQAPAGDPGRKPPRLSSGELQRLLPDWRVKRSVLLSNGWQEYCFEC